MSKRRATLGTSIAVNGTAGTPEWVQLLPAGPGIVGRDGRAWIMVDPAEVVTASAANGPLHVDYEHASETRASAGQEAPAAGWIESLEVREGAVWGRVAWTPRAAEMIASREYRFLSPVFYFDTETRRIQSLVSAGLTNRPNLDMTALNRAEDANDNPTRTSMTPEQFKALCRALAIDENVTPATVVTAVEALRAEKAANRNDVPSLDRYVPRADYDAVRVRADEAEKALNTIKAERAEAELAGLVDDAVKAGKIAPASRDAYLAICRKGGVDEFKALVAAAPVMTAPSPLDNKTPAPANTNGALSDVERAVCRQLGLSEEAFLKSKAAA